MKNGTSKEIATTRTPGSFDRMNIPTVMNARIVIGDRPDADLDDLERQIGDEAKKTRTLLDELGGDPAPSRRIPSWLVEAFKSSKGRILTLQETRDILSKCRTPLSDDVLREREDGD